MSGWKWVILFLSLHIVKARKALHPFEFQHIEFPPNFQLFKVFLNPISAHHAFAKLGEPTPFRGDAEILKDFLS